ncbi:MAG: hypothetical protein ONB48_13620 [candidate division KSB1 bacterium]|nr:hypothetical protein [candidate division KSB1 bacterium]MDZ7286688.1 hypothetical protein [candidate division KSB1 bacterium]MDZ7299149.1 hypothetical protein [candidate division KSB1 bacterium]MDZ7309627.1 hypothetical protein [candidate division KSB1 bacterium]MDZ7353873.1 hypothetical protein [candidate division KSB1 bacterium]
MEQTSRKNNIFIVKCAHCHKPFHYKAKSESQKSKSDDAGEEEIVLACPYCQKKLMVTVPRRFLEKETLYRGPVRELESRIANG